MKQGIILDLDGVICDTAEFHYKAWKRLAEEYDLLLSHEHNEQLKGVSRADSLKLILEWAGRQLTPTQFERDLNRKNGWYLELVESMTSSDLLPGVKDFFERAVRYNIPLALGSASKNAKLVLSKVGLIDAFKAIVDAGMISQGKPHPETFLTAAQMLNLAPESCIVFEDSLSGVQAAKTGNMYVVGVGVPQDLPLADEYVSNLGNYDFQSYLNL